MTSAKRPTSAFVLAAGKGERMRPLTNTLPKPLVPLDGKPLIDHVLDRLADAGVKRAVVNVHYLADKIEKHLAHRSAPKIIISDERDKLLDTGGGAVRALPKLGAGPFVIHNSDSVWIEGLGSNLDRLLSGFDADLMDSLMLVAPLSASIGYDGLGDFQMDATGRLTRQTGPRLAPFVFAGVSIAHPRLFENAPSGAFSLNKLWDRAIDKGRLYGLRLEGIWMHVGTPDALKEAEAALSAPLATSSD
ncbi:nucleotidyltransferase family protein [Hyphomicrobium facile]|uniref:MobA-like NTP transferase domain-containing protein n=1 Tax=Hyphomicrobium facile TaxID=51670 RepID=A0A1I7MV51_9HYPH|nr:nucleotidyltransferase family protein [Hyphomicrobium facile]SFV26267.1 MobA-like NTP transferase domain-containing protein [Hyphomicrobium facile]